MKNIRIFFFFFFFENFQCLLVKFSVNLNRRVFVMAIDLPSAESNHVLNCLYKLVYITKTCLHNSEPHFYKKKKQTKKKLGFTGAYVFFSYICLKHRLWVLVINASLRRF